MAASLFSVASLMKERARLKEEIEAVKRQRAIKSAQLSEINRLIAVYGSEESAEEETEGKSRGFPKPKIRCQFCTGSYQRGTGMAAHVRHQHPDDWNRMKATAA